MEPRELNWYPPNLHRISDFSARPPLGRIFLSLMTWSKVFLFFARPSDGHIYHLKSTPKLVLITAHTFLFLCLAA